MEYKELDTYFKLRFEELLNKRTPDSYRVRHHNVLSILSELCELIDGWREHRILSPETVVLCGKECIKLLEKDLWLDFSFYDKDMLIEDIKKYIDLIPKNKDNRGVAFEISDKLKYSCCKCVDINSTTYASAILTFIIDKIAKSGDMDKDKAYVKVMGEFDNAVVCLCKEFIRLGYSKNYLYKKAEELLQGNISIKDLKTKLLNRMPVNYSVNYKIRSNSYIELCKNPFGFVEELRELKQSMTTKRGDVYHKSFFNNAGFLFKSFEVEALDPYAAVIKSKAKLGLMLDTLFLGNDVNAGQFASKVLVTHKISEDRSWGDLLDFNYQLDGTYESDPQQAVVLEKKVNDVLNNTLIKDDVKERLKSALRHLRMANESRDIELRFINYWIALEFIFSSPVSNEHTYGRLNKHLVNILCASYIGRNVSYLDTLLIADGSLEKGKTLSNLTEKEWGQLINKVADRRTQYRLCKMKSHLHSKENIEAYLKAHKENLEWHLARIYRMRNELIHEAAIKQDIEGISSNLRFYLVFLLNQIIDFFDGTAFPVGMNDFFHHYENIVNVLFSKKERGQVLRKNYETSIIS